MSDPADDHFDFASFQQRLAKGESDAAKKLFEDYSQRLVHLASQNVNPALLKRFDGEDVVQSVFRTFFRQQQEGKFEFDCSQQLWQLLATLTLCKTRSHARKHTAEKRNAKLEQGQTDEAQILGREPSHEDALALWEEIDVVLSGLPDRAGEILSMRLEGRNRSEIAEQLNVSRQTIHRLLNLIQQRLQLRFQQLSPQDSTNLEKNKESG